MINFLLSRNNVWLITISLSVCSIFASVLIIVLLAMLFNQQEYLFALSMGVVCPTIIAPVAIYSSLHLARKLEESRRKVEELKEDLKQASNAIEELSEMLPICSVCKKIRDDKGYWSQIESYISSHSNVGFSHGYCPTCYEREVAKIEKWKEENVEVSGPV